MVRKRPLGRTGESLSVIGFGGLLVWDEDPATAERLVAEAVDRGINYFDVAPSYGNAQERMGPALEPYRDSVFLACKTLARTQDEAWHELRDSLKVLRTDHLDLYQLHAVNTREEIEQIMSPGGAIETFAQAREQGLVRNLGFSSHSEAAALELLDRFEFDTVLYPFNWICWYQGDLGRRVLETAQRKGMGILGLKAMAKRRLKEGESRPWPKCWYVPAETAEEAAIGIRFALSLPVTATVSPGHAQHLWWACDTAQSFKPLTPDEFQELEQASVGCEPLFRHDSHHDD
jgi:aryl-alcohol dehydrogenase-like predicted oxidoreductase